MWTVRRAGALIALVVVAGGCAALAAEAAARSKPRATPVAVTVDTAHPGVQVPPSFLGFSIEYPDVPIYAGTPQRPNRPFARLLGSLGGYGNGPAVLRIGGNSTDQSWWNPAHAPRPANVFNDLDPAWVSSLATLVAAVRTPVILGVNLGLNDAANALAFAGAVGQALPAHTLQSLEVGNEPDLYTRPKSFRVGRRLLRRPQHRASYDFETYLRELDSYLSALSPLGHPLLAGGFASVAWDLSTPELLDRERRRLAGLSAHSYPLNTCGSKRRNAASLGRRLLGNTQAVRRITALAAVASARGVPLRVTEANSMTCGGVKGASDTFASALWAVNVLFGYLNGGAAGVNLHTWSGAYYAPVDFRAVAGRTAAVVRPLFYGLMLFARATADGAQLLPTVSTRRQGLTVWATRARAGVVRVLIVNASGSRTRGAVVRIAGVSGRGSVERLTARSLRAASGVRLAGRSYGRVSSDGRLRGRRRVEAVTPHRGRYRFLVPPASAALLTLQP